MWGNGRYEIFLQTNKDIGAICVYHDIEDEAEEQGRYSIWQEARPVDANKAGVV